MQRQQKLRLFIIQQQVKKLHVFRFLHKKM